MLSDGLYAGGQALPAVVELHSVQRVSLLRLSRLQLVSRGALVVLQVIDEEAALLSSDGKHHGARRGPVRAVQVAVSRFKSE